MTVRTLRFFLRRPRTRGAESTWAIYYVVY
jgi:hypothetical protein